MANLDNGKLAPQQRSPTYPYISIDVAIERAKKIFAEIRDHAQPREVVAKAYGKPATSSATIQTFATLLQYGLLENIAGPTGRKMRVSGLAQRILNPHAPLEKVRQDIKIAALNPPIFAELWSRFGDTSGLNDNVLLYYLTSEREHEHGGTFTDKAAHEVLRVYRATIAYADISASTSKEIPTIEEGNPSGEQAAKVGDFVQVEVNGVLQFKQPKQIESIQEHQGKLWVFLEGEKTAVEMDQVILQNDFKPAPDITPPRRDLPTRPELPQESWSEESLIDDTGNEIKIRYMGQASIERYEFIRDYLNFKIQRLTKKSPEI